MAFKCIDYEAFRVLAIAFHRAMLTQFEPRRRNGAEVTPMNRACRSSRFVRLTTTANRNLGFAFLLLLALLSFFLVVPTGVAVSGKGFPHAQLQTPPTEVAAKEQQKTAATCPTCAPPTPQVIYAPLFDVPEAAGSEIVLNCRSARELEVTPTFYTIEGKPIVGDVIHLQPAEIRFVETKSLIPRRERNRHRWGGMSLSYTGNLLEGWAQLTLHGIRGGGSSNVFFTVANQPRANRIESVWWMPRNAEAFIALGNSSDKPVHANLIFKNGESRSVNIGAFATEIVRPRGEGLSLSSSDAARSEAVSINYTGPAGSLIPAGFISSASSKFTSTIRFYNPANIVQPNLYANNLRLKDGAPHMVLRNTSADFLTARLRFLTEAGTPVDTFKLATLILRPNEVAEVDLRPLASAAAKRSDLDSISVQVLNSGAPGSLIGALYGQNKKIGLTYDVPLRDSGPPRASTGAYPVRLDGDYTTLLSITNVGEKQGDATLQINYEGGKYELGLITFNPGETRTFDIRKLRDDQTPDRDGSPFPRDLTTGQVRWSMRGNGSVPLFGRVEVVSLREGVSSSYSCWVCCPNTFYDGDVNPDDASIVVDDTQPLTATQRERDCYGNVYGSNNVSAAITWNSGDPSVATVDSIGQATGVDSGTAGVSATWTADIWLQDWDGSCTYDQWSTPPAYSYVDVSRVQISGAQSVQDGGSASFSVTLTGSATVSSYAWSFTAPSGAGNSPNVNFSSATSASTNTDAHWFASPNTECAPANSTYTIKCHVILSNNKHKDVQTTLTVTTPTRAGETLQPHFAPNTYPAYGQNSSNQWVVTGPGNLSRVQPASSIFVSGGQFQNKAEAHEQKHVAQYATGMNSDLFTVSGVMVVLSPLTDATESGLQTKIFNATNSYFAAQNAILNQRRPQAEDEAYGVSDPITPQYRYQKACQ